MEKDWIERYTALNNSYKKKLIFRLGANAGFFSEFNNMVFAILYCLENKIKFVLSSNNTNFSIEKGWEDFFLPFCPHVTDPFHRWHNLRPHQIAFYSKVNPFHTTAKWKLRVLLYKLFNPNTLLIQDVWDLFHNKQFCSKKIVVQELGINHRFLEACHVIVENIWRFQPDVNRLLKQRIDDLKLPAEYAAVHIRGGDKITENSLYPPSSYMVKLQETVNLQDVFIATDDYSNIASIKAQYTNYNFYTLCKSAARGHLQSDFDEKTGILKKELMLNLFSDVEVLRKSKLFVGTYSSNIGMFMGMCVGENTCSCLDFDHWLIWGIQDYKVAS